MNLLDYQVKPTATISNRMASNLASFLVAPCRTGKTYAVAEAIRKAQDAGKLLTPGKPCNVLWLVPKSGRIQTARILKKAGVKNFYVDAPSMLRSSLGEAMFIDWVSIVKYGETILVPVWREENKPDIIIGDEWHMYKNTNTQQSMCMNAAINQGILICGMSATPGVKVGEMKLMATALKMCSEYDWPILAKEICLYTDPMDLNSAAMKRFNDKAVLTGGLIKFENIHYKHKTKNILESIDFCSPEKEKIYALAYETYQEECRKAGKHTPEGIRAQWVAMVKFQVAAEILRGEELSDFAIVKHKQDKQVIIASKYIETLRRVWTYLVKKHKVNPDRIIYILGDQSDEARQQAMDRWQKGNADFALISMKAGGVSISLHHEFSNKENRPRAVILPPVWSAIDFVQMLGRAHGPTSLSTTEQYTLWYRNTIEDKVKERLENKGLCLKEMVTKRETWTALFTGEAEADEPEALKELINNDVAKDEEGEVVAFDLDNL